MKVASTQFSLEKVNTPEEFWLRAETLIQSAKKDGAEVIVFPEYFSLSLMMCELASQHADFTSTLHHSQAHSERAIIQAQTLAKKHAIAIVLGTLPWANAGKLVNRSCFISSDGQQLSQDKIFMTRFENEVWNVSSGEKTVNVFEWKNKVCAILTCYDSEFAVLSQTLARAGVELLFVPSCTDTEHGYWRVRHCCEARAVENQLFVVMSSIVSGDPTHEEISEHYGKAAIFSPCDSGFPANGSLSEGQTNQEGYCMATLDFAKLDAVRKGGAVFNLKDSVATNQIPSKNISLK